MLPLTWLSKGVGELQPVLIIVDTLTDFSSIEHGASNAGYEETTAKLGQVYRCAQERRVHVHLFHHSSSKGDLEGLAAVLGSTGIVSKPGTVLIYKRLHPTDVDSPRVDLRPTRMTDMDEPLGEWVLFFAPTAEQVRRVRDIVKNHHARSEAALNRVENRAGATRGE